MEYGIISADDHIDLQWMPKDVWQKRVPPEWRERAPKVVETPEGPAWVCGDDKWELWGGRPGAAGARGGTPHRDRSGRGVRARRAPPDDDGVAPGRHDPGRR